MRLLGVIVLLTELWAADIGQALKVVVTPGPAVEFTVGERGALFCRISQARRKNGRLALVWLYSNSFLDGQRILRLNRTGHVQTYTSCRASRCDLQSYEQGSVKVYVLILKNVSKSDEGHYRCRVQEIANLNKKWVSISNGNSTTEVKVRLPQTTIVPTSERTSETWTVPEDFDLETSTVLISRNPKEPWTVYGDVYLYSVLVCSLGIVSVILFAAVIACQTLRNRKKARARHYLMKGPNSSSGETVMSVRSTSALQPKKDKKTTGTEELPPPIPVKIPTRDVSSKRKLWKRQEGKSIMPRIAEDSLTYAELELVPTQPGNASAQASTTVYAKIFFSNNKDQLNPSQKANDNEK
ncbi:V-set and transmembrane domain-containing protein 4 isoform X1 [Callorhinchus milii]|uniref:Putative Ig-like domain-containing protein C10orf72-like protein n=2 Tax=Callorhinchus milii TaxID=7868 RepID=V9KMI8_CALMI|nr:V-set and transmembrane domain-containing protein 4 isoform X1 [Callorhinchus milii]|eukprot:gi/632972658/ref/XP_007902767.1/ PREDICTED: V-set and transmembrane domain-containing protein 4 isoform X1 [Callorhinchus milii]